MLLTPPVDSYHNQETTVLPNVSGLQLAITARTISTSTPLTGLHQVVALTTDRLGVHSTGSRQIGNLAHQADSKHVRVYGTRQTADRSEDTSPRPDSVAAGDSLMAWR